MTLHVLAILCSVVALPAVHADTLRLPNGDTVTGTITKREGGKVYVKSQHLGEITIDERHLTSVAAGETTPDQPTPPRFQPTPAAVASSAPVARANNRPIWSRTLSLGGVYQSAIYSPTGSPLSAGSNPGSFSSFHGTAGLERVTSTDSLLFRASLNYAETKPWGRQSHSYEGDFAWHHHFAPRSHTVARTGYRVDRVRNIDYSAFQFGGIGYHAVRTDRTSLTIAPGLVLMQAEKGNQFDHELHWGPGLEQTFNYLFNETVSFEQQLFFRQSLKSTAFWEIDTKAGIKAAMNEHLNFLVMINYRHDHTLGFPATTTLPGGGPKKDSVETTYGIELKF